MCCVPALWCTGSGALRRQCRALKGAAATDASVGARPTASDGVAVRVEHVLVQRRSGDAVADDVAIGEGDGRDRVALQKKHILRMRHNKYPQNCPEKIPEILLNKIFTDKSAFFNLEHILDIRVH